MDSVLILNTEINVTSVDDVAELLQKKDSKNNRKHDVENRRAEGAKGAQRTSRRPEEPSIWDAGEVPPLLLGHPILAVFHAGPRHSSHPASLMFFLCLQLNKRMNYQKI